MRVSYYIFLINAALQLTKIRKEKDRLQCAHIRNARIVKFLTRHHYFLLDKVSAHLGDLEYE